MLKKAENDLIRRSAIVDILRAKSNMAVGTEYQILFDHIANLIEKIHSVDAEPVRHGQWLNDGACSLCGAFDTRDPFGSGYCQNCGAKMDGGA